MKKLALILGVLSLVACTRSEGSKLQYSKIR